MRLTWRILPWLLLVLSAAAASMLAVLSEPVRYWAGVSFAAPLLLASPVLVPWLLFSLYVLWRRPERREKQLRRIGYVLAAFAALSTLWVIQQFARGAYAERVIRAVKSYDAQHGQYPETLEQVGFATCCQGTATLQWEIAYVGASGGEGHPAVFYPGALPFSMNQYDFQRAQWTYFED